MSSLAEAYISPEEYLELERQAETKSEYFNGQIFAMSGASEPHNVITVNLTREISTQLRGRPCRMYSNDMRVLVDDTGLYTYPDAVVVCGERILLDGHKDTLLNPSVIIEVLSPSTERYDRGEKFAHYRHLESLTDYLLIAQDRPRVEHFTKLGNQEWVMRVMEELDAIIPILSINCELNMAFIYEDVDFPNDQPLR
jgi:Uma2 family endonuclease